MKNRNLVNLWIGLGCALLVGLVDHLRRWLEHSPYLTNVPLLPPVEFHAALADNLLAGWHLSLADAWPTGIALGSMTLLTTIALSRLSIGGGVVGQYAPPRAPGLPLQPPEQLDPTSARRESTIFISDVIGFNSLSEGLRPDEVVDLTKQYLAVMSDVVFESNGHLDRYIGDGIMAFWNAPTEQPDHAVLACRCALRSLARLDKLNREFTARGWRPLKIRIGLSTGMVVAGHVGSVRKKDYTVLGSPVSLALRLEAANKSLGTTILLSEATQAQVQDHFETRFLDYIRIPGESQPIKIYELLGEKNQLTP